MAGDTFGGSGPPRGDRRGRDTMTRKRADRLSGVGTKEDQTRTDEALGVSWSEVRNF